MSDEIYQYLSPLGEIFSTNPTKPLYHYTSVQGLSGIVEKKKLWATDARYLNDSSEVSYIASIADELLSIESVIRQHQQEDIRVLQVSLDEWRTSQSRLGGVFVSSLSENQNQLSQWRGYCPPGAGVSIGFDSVELHTSLVPRKVVTVKVLYDLDKQKRIVEGILSYLLDGDVPDAYQGATRTESLQEELHLLLSIAGPVLKHPGFHEEAEWRLIYSEKVFSQLFRYMSDCEPQLFPDPIPSLPVQYRARGTQLVPYVALPLVAHEQDVLDFDSICTGPGTDPVFFEETLKDFLHSKDVAVKRFVPSGIPLRVS